MKNSSCLLLIAALLAISCNESISQQNITDSTTTTTINSSEDTSLNFKIDSINRAATSMDELSTRFIEDATQQGIMEVELGNAAMILGSSKAIKDFGKKVVKDYTSFNKFLEELALENNFMAPSDATASQKKLMDSLINKTDKDFDNAYIKVVLEEHKKDLENFKKSGKILTDPKLKNFAKNSTSIIQAHLDEILAIQKNK